MPAIGLPQLYATLTPSEFTATAAQTTFQPLGGYTAPYLKVEVNGSALRPSDYTAVDGINVVLNTARSAGDQVVIWAFGAFNIAGSGATAGGCIYENSDTITADYTLTKNGMRSGDLTINTGIGFTIASGKKLVIL